MSESIPRAWILNHVLSIAKTRGANFYDAPPDNKKKRIQITQFITFPDHKRPDDVVWAVASDKHHRIPVKFTAAAVTDYNRRLSVTGKDPADRRLTKHRYAVASIKDVKLFFARIPLQFPSEDAKMTKDEYLALEVGHVDVLGADHEGPFGSPIWVSETEDILAWVKGLREGGGGGNVLLTEALQTKMAPGVTKAEPLKLTKIQQDRVTEHVAEKNKAHAAETGPFVSPDPKKEYNRRWKVVAQLSNIINPFHTPLFFVDNNSQRVEERTISPLENEKVEIVQDAKVDKGNLQPHSSREEQMPNRQSTPSEWGDSGSEDVPDKNRHPNTFQAGISAKADPSTRSSKVKITDNSKKSSDNGNKGTDVGLISEENTNDTQTELNDRDKEFLENILKSLKPDSGLSVQSNDDGDMNGPPKVEAPIKEEDKLTTLPEGSVQEKSSQDEESTLEDSSYHATEPPQPGQPRRQRSGHGITSSSSPPQFTESQLREVESSLHPSQPSHPSSSMDRNEDAMEVDIKHVHERDATVKVEEGSRQISQTSSTTQPKAQRQGKRIHLKPPEGWKWPTWEEIADDLLYVGRARNPKNI